MAGPSLFERGLKKGPKSPIHFQGGRWSAAINPLNPPNKVEPSHLRYGHSIADVRCQKAGRKWPRRQLGRVVRTLAKSDRVKIIRSLQFLGKSKLHCQNLNVLALPKAVINHSFWKGMLNLTRCEKWQAHRSLRED